MIAGIRDDDLFVDIETSYNLIADFSLGYNKSINYKQIIREREIISISWVWGDDPIISGRLWDYKEPHGQRDEGLLYIFSKEMDKAGRIIAQNGKRFDIPFLRTRNLLNKGRPMPNITMLDPLLEDRRWFNFNSNSQDYLSRLLLKKGKMKMELQNWIDVVEYNDPEALLKMLEYNKDDVSDMRNLFKIIQPHIPTKSHKIHEDSNGNILCTVCGGPTRSCGTYKTQAGVYPRWRCLDYKCDKTGHHSKQIKEKR